MSYERADFPVPLLFRFREFRLFVFASKIAVCFSGLGLIEELLLLQVESLDALDCLLLLLFWYRDFRGFMVSGILSLFLWVLFCN